MVFVCIAVECAPPVLILIYFRHSSCEEETKEEKYFIKFDKLAAID